MEFLFTQEQYKDIINGLHDSLTDDLRDYIFWNDLEKEAMELANPNTRESAKLKYVKPEPKSKSKYTWYYKNTNRFINKVKGDPQWFLDDDLFDTLTKFTEEEIDASPFKKEFFRKEK